MHLMEKIHKLSTKHWLITSLILIFPSAWFTFVQVFGRSFDLVFADGTVRIRTIAISILMLVAYIPVIIVKSIKDKNKAESLDNNQKLFDRILSSTNEICYKKYERFSKYISDNYNSKIVKPFFEITQPKTQIDLIIEGMKKCFAGILGLDEKQIGISLITNIDVDSKHWSWFSRIKSDGGLKLSELTTNVSTSTYQIISGAESIIFYPDKKVAISLNKYYPDSIDKINGSIGSILCKRLEVGEEGKTYVQAILSITTYGKQMCSQNDENSKRTILNELLPPFEERIKLELSLDYIKSVLTLPERCVV